MLAIRSSVRHWLLMGYLALGLGPAVAPADVVKVFLLGGQSNMVGQALTTGLPSALQSPQDDVLFYYRYKGNVTPLTTLRPNNGGPNANGFGPEITFGRTIADAFPDEHFALIKMGGNGTSLYSSWDPTPEGPAQGTTYVAFQNTVTDGLNALIAAGHTPQIVGMLWTQGEADGLADRTTAQYQAELAEFIADIRTRYGENLPFFLNRLSTGQRQLSIAQLTQIRTAQENVASADPFTYLIDADGLSQGDTVHFNAAGQMQLGERFGHAYIATVPEPVMLMPAVLGGLAALWRRR